MLTLLFVLKNERQQCQYKQSKNHKILEGEYTIDITSIL